MTTVYKKRDMLRQRTRGDEEENPVESRRDEKPVLCSPKINKLSTPLLGLIIIVLWFILHSLAVYLNGHLPAMRFLSNEVDEPGRFVGERAKVFLTKLADIGVKVTGSHENEFLAVALIEKEITSIINEANTLHEITLDHQKVSGSFFLAFTVGFLSHYSRVQNLIVKIGPKQNANSSLLVNCHFDSAPTSPGASDDGLNCAVMLETLRVISQQKTVMDHNIIFLFNGAEETPLQASHGFIAHHRWAKEVKAFINLESCGAGGHEFLFQTGPGHSWLVELYADAVEHPSGSVLGEDIFQGGLVPSDTDFRVFRDYGKIPGLDFAHCDNGFVYHTRYDDANHIEDGVYQHTGDNLLALVKKFSKSTKLANAEQFKEGRAVYFDLFGLYMIVYSETLGIIINIAVVLLSLCSVLQNTFTYTAGLPRKEVMKQLFLSTLNPVLGIVTAVCFALGTAVILDALSATNAWYSKQYLILPLYFAPTLIALFLPSLLLNKLKSSNLCAGIRAQLYCNGFQLLWTIVLFLAILTGFRSAYLIMIAVVFTATVNCLLTVFNYQHSASKWLPVYVGTSIIPAFYFAYIYVMAMSLFIPISGRSGPNVNPDLIIGVMSTLLCCLIFGYMSPLILLVWKPWKLVLGFLIVYLVTVITVIATPFGFPFSQEYPERILMFHVERNLHSYPGGEVKTDSGLWLYHIDRTAPSTYSAFPWFKNLENVDIDCERYIYCGMPFYYSRSAKTDTNPGSWIPAPAPKFENNTSMELTSIQSIGPDLKRYNFSVDGPNQMRIFLSPKENVDLVNWDFESKPVAGPKWGNRPTYMIGHTTGLPSPSWNFSIDLKVSNMVVNSNQESSHLIDVAISGHYVDSSEQQKKDLHQYTQHAPEWAHFTAWAVQYRAYVF